MQLKMLVCWNNDFLKDWSKIQLYVDLLYEKFGCIDISELYNH